MTKAKPHEHVVELGHPRHAGTTVVVAYNDLLMPLTRERVLELLASEQRLLKLLTQSDAAPSTLALRTRRRRSRQKHSDQAPLGVHLTHASLSTRIKKIFDAAAPLGTLRPAHAILLPDVLDSFDWQLPDHPNTRLELQLAEIVRWPDTAPDLARQVTAFLERYTALRAARAHKAG